MNFARRLAGGLVAVFALRKFRHVVVALAVSAVVVAGLGGAVPGDRYDLLSGAIWLPSRVGQVTLLSGAASQPMASVGVARNGATLSVSQSGADAIVVDHDAGTVRRVSGSTFDAERPVRFADDGSRLQVFVSGSHAFVLDGARGVVYRVEPTTLRSLDTAVTLEADVREGSAVVDRVGRLWAIDHKTGDLVWVDGKLSHRRTGAGSRKGTLVTVAGNPVLVTGGQAQWLDEHGQSGATVDLGLRPGEDAVVSGAASGQLLVVFPRQGVLRVCTAAGCDGAAYALPPGHAFGPTVGYRGHWVVPDFTSGTVLIFARDDANPLRVEVLKPTARFELEVRDTILFYNDTASDRAGVLRLDGSRTEMHKYDVNHPGAGIDHGSKHVVLPPIAPPKASVPPAEQSRRTETQLSAGPTHRTTAGSDGSADRATTGSGSGAAPATGPDRAARAGSQGDSSGRPGSGSTAVDPPPSAPLPPGPPTGSTTPPPAVFDLVGFSVTPSPARVGEPVSVGDVRATGGVVRTCRWRIGAMMSSVPCDSTITAAIEGSNQVVVDVVSTTGSPASETLGLEVSAPAGDPFQILYVGLSSDTVPAGDPVRVHPGFKAGPPKQCTWTVGTASALSCDASTSVADPGTYRVTIWATSPAGLASDKSTTLTVSAAMPPPPDKPGKPTIAQPADCLTANADVSVSATPPAGVVDSWHWQVDGQDAASTGASLSFHSAVSASDKQLVSVYVSNSAGDSEAAVATICLADRTPPVLSVRSTRRLGLHSVTVTVTLTAVDEESPLASTSLDVWFEVTSECSDPPVSRTVHKSDPSSVAENGGSCADTSFTPAQITANDVGVSRYTASATSAGGTAEAHGP